MRVEETYDLLENADKSNKVEKLTSFNQAKDFLTKEKCVVITGVQGSGKTFLAERLVNDLKNRSNIKEAWISNLTALRQEKKLSTRTKDIYVFDGIFYELQSYQTHKETVDDLEHFLKNIENRCLIFTSPSKIWQTHATHSDFEATYSKMNVDLDKRNADEKQAILKSLMKRYSVSGEEARRLSELQNDLLKYDSGCIGFPALISWVCKQPIDENVEELINNPLQSISNKIVSLKNSLDVKEKAKYFILAYMSFKDGKMKRNGFDNTFFDTLKNLYDAKFEYKNLNKYAREMVGYYLVESKKCCFELDSNIIQKIVLVSVAKDHAAFFQKHCKVYFEYVISERQYRDLDFIDRWYAECFTTV